MITHLKTHKRNILITLGYVAVIVAISTITFFNFDKIFHPGQHKINFEEFRDVFVNAKSVYVYDAKENVVLYEKNSRVPMPLASITKLATVGCALDTLSTDMEVKVPDAVYSYYDGQAATGKSEVWSIKDLAIYTLITSSNSGAIMLASNIDGEENAVRCMNVTADSLGLFETSFANVTGLDIDEKNPGSLGSAENVVRLLQYVYNKYEDIVGKTAYPNFNILSKNGMMHKASNTNLITDKITGIMASKTGLTDLAGGNLVFVIDVGLNHKVYVSILGSTEMGRFYDAIALTNATLKSLSNYNN